MSSLISHAVVGFASSKYKKGAKNFLWILWLVFAAIAPDADYILEWFFGIRFQIRYTHSIGFCFAFSILTIIALRLAKVQHLRIYFAQIFLASYSHLFLDLLVGVYKSPWLWPLSSNTYSLPFGILPSAGKITLFNKYMYRNLLIEMGIILPILFVTDAFKVGNVKRNLATAMCCLCIWIPFVFWGLSLKR